tara:strand:- start:456 stop:1088 length:633 start_codon:yes stop_codon:yes gene_type:complete
MSIVPKLFNSRKIVLNMIGKRGFNVDKYSNFTFDEIDVLFNSSNNKLSNELAPLDIKLENDGYSLYIKYVLNLKNRPTNIINFIQEFRDTQMNEGDTLILITLDKIISETLDEFLDNLYEEFKVFAQVFYIDKLMYDVTEHVLVPKHIIISEEEKSKLLNNLSINNFDQLPIILKNDPVAMYCGAKKNEVMKIIKNSETVGEYISYRYVQ